MGRGRERRDQGCAWVYYLGLKAKSYVFAKQFPWRKRLGTIGQFKQGVRIRIPHASSGAIKPCGISTKVGYGLDSINSDTLKQPSPYSWTAKMLHDCMECQPELELVVEKEEVAKGDWAQTRLTRTASAFSLWRRKGVLISWKRTPERGDLVFSECEELHFKICEVGSSLGPCWARP